MEASRASAASLVLLRGFMRQKVFPRKIGDRQGGGGDRHSQNRITSGNGETAVRRKGCAGERCGRGAFCSPESRARQVTDPSRDAVPRSPLQKERLESALMCRIRLVQRHPCSLFRDDCRLRDPLPLQTVRRPQRPGPGAENCEPQPAANDGNGSSPETSLPRPVRAPPTPCPRPAVTSASLSAPDHFMRASGASFLSVVPQG